MEYKIEKINGNDIYTVNWKINNPKAAILIVHGFAEHSGRYEHVAKFFNDHSFQVYSYDLLGHGKSSGIRAFVKDFTEYNDELEAIVKTFKSANPKLPLFILGHSMGGLIVGMNAVKGKLQDINNIILSNPALDIDSNQPKILVGIVRLLAKIVPKMPTVKLDSKFISRDEQVRKSYDTDPLNYRGGSRPGMVNQFDQAGKWLAENADQFRQNLYLNYSKTDKVVFPEGSEKFFAKVGSADKKIDEYSGLYHEILNEPEKLQVLENMLSWCEQRIA